MTPVAFTGLNCNICDLKGNCHLETFDELNGLVRSCMTNVQARIHGDGAQTDAVVQNVLKFTGTQLTANFRQTCCKLERSRAYLDIWTTPTSTKTCDSKADGMDDLGQFTLTISTSATQNYDV